MDQEKLINILGLVPNGDLSVTDVQMVQWGRDLVFSFLYETTQADGLPDTPIEFCLIFRDCREIKYRVYAHISLHEQGQITSVADLVEIHLGSDNHRRDANLLTNHFGVSVSYGSVHLERNSTEYPISD